MSTARVIGLLIAWTLASIMIAVVTAIVATEVLRLVGLVETGESSYSIAINTVFVIVLVVRSLYREKSLREQYVAAMVLVPLLLRAFFIK